MTETLDLEQLQPPKLTSRPVTPDDTSDLVKVFELDDKPYFIAKRPPASAVLRFMKSSRLHDETYAMQEMLENLLGAEAYEALCSCPSLGMDEWATICRIVSKYTVGLFEAASEASGNSSGGSQG